jgi:Holliday junction resolvasome RuvABC endonuclease subunit
MVVLGLDISSVSTGWAILTDGPTLKDYGRLELSSKKSIKERIYLFSILISQILDIHHPDIVVIEDTYIAKNPSTSKLLNKFAGVAIYSCVQKLGADAKIAMVYPVSVRAAIFPKKKVDKKDIFCYIKDKYKLNLEFKFDNDITDAIAVAMYPFLNSIEGWL